MNEEKMIVVKSACVDPQVRLRYQIEYSRLHPAVSYAILILEKRENNRPQGVDLSKSKWNYHPSARSKFWGGFSMPKTLLDKRKYECQ